MTDLNDDKSKLSRLIRNRWFQAASALGVVLGIIGFVISLPPVADMAFGKRVSLTLDVVSQIPVFAVRQPVPGLSVQLNSRDLTQTRRDLVAARLRLRNNGEVSINSRNTTSRDPLGFVVKGGEVVRLYELGATSDHLRKLALPQRNGNSFTLPPGLIIDPGDFVQFDLLIVRPVSGNLTFTSLGKVEGLKQIAVGRSDMAKPTPNAASTAWSGGLLPQVLRTVTYPFIAIALIAGAVAAGFGLQSVKAGRKRRQREAFVQKGLANWQQDDPKLRKLVPTMYAAIGLNRLTALTDTERQKRADEIREARWKRYEEEKLKPLAEFEAAGVIEKRLSESEVSSSAIENLLVRLTLRDAATEEIDPVLTAAIESFAAALTGAVPVEDLRRADPPDDSVQHEFMIRQIEAAGQTL